MPASLASLNRGTGAVLYGSGKLGSTWQKTRWPPPFSHLALLFIYGASRPRTDLRLRVGGGCPLLVGLLSHLLGYLHADLPKQEERRILRLVQGGMTRRDDEVAGCRSGSGRNNINFRIRIHKIINPPESRILERPIYKPLHLNFFGPQYC